MTIREVTSWGMDYDDGFSAGLRGWTVTPPEGCEYLGAFLQGYEEGTKARARAFAVGTLSALLPPSRSLLARFGREAGR